jgi:hypothetical protein
LRASEQKYALFYFSDVAEQGGKNHGDNNNSNKNTNV